MKKNTQSELKSVKKEISKAIVGQEEVIDFLLISILSGGHAILQGVPGLAKTMMIHALARSIKLSFNRIQFTPDMVPTDITGTEVLIENDGKREFKFIKGPIFANVILADEINRTPPKTQSALLQAMQEHEVTQLGKTYRVPKPFFVLATQNPIEYEGTYPLPEAQLDRFMLFINVQYPSYNQELEIMDIENNELDKIQSVLQPNELLKISEQVGLQTVSEKVKGYILNLVRSTRPLESELTEIKHFIDWGAGPRASQMLLKAAKARSFLYGKAFVDKEDVDAVFLPVMRHRVISNYHARSENIQIEDLLIGLKKHVEASL